MNNKIDRLIYLTNNANTNEKRTRAVWILVTYLIKDISTNQLFSLIPFIWKLEHDYSGKFFGIRQKIEQEIQCRQEKEAVSKLLDLLQNNHPYLRCFAASMLIYFHDEMAVQPFLVYLENTDDDYMSKRQVLYAILGYKDPIVDKFLLKEVKKERRWYKRFIKDMMMDNYRITLESESKKRGLI